ncbi:MAG: GTPase ObgE [Gammaproteobacteria bacterium]|nr:GTPase ObgE [Gammaproteobacteria bacterium]
MKFTDEAYITVHAGKGGDGCLSFRREKFIEFGGPDGGEGGDGGSIYLVATSRINTLVDFRFRRSFNALNGQPGMGRDRIGKSGVDLEISVPVGTQVHDADTGEDLGDLATDGARIVVAEGGYHGFGNAHFKSSTNRAPRRITKGTPGESRRLALELKLLADVGLLGLPNAGKSTFIRQVSAARPKVADYPFTTLEPVLGVVSLGPERSFVIADIPGIIEGAAEGAGLGLQFLRHVERTEILLHIVDVSRMDPARDPKVDFATVSREIKKHSRGLAKKERWLVLNKIDALAPEERAQDWATFAKRVRWKGSVFVVSGFTGEGCRELLSAVDRRLQERGDTSP